MAKRQREWARHRRQQLIEQLGGRCAVCGTTEDLEIDHLQPRDYDPAALSQDMRVSRYVREAAAGWVQVLCATHNAKKGFPEDKQPGLPEAVTPF